MAAEQRIINLTQHVATPEQSAAGVVEPAEKAEIQRLLTFSDPPDLQEMPDRAERLVDIARASGAAQAMIGGAPYFMAPLEQALMAAGIRPLYSFTRREAVDQPQPDGSVRKVQIFRHTGWVGE